MTACFLSVARSISVPINTQNSIVVNHAEWDRLLKRYVDSSGIVNYNDFVKAENELNVYLRILSQNPPKENSSSNYKLAYWINAYNAFTVKLILDHYPLQSIKDISNGLAMIDSPWDIKFFEIGGISFDLNTIVHEILRKHFAEPRIHFAINCASASCPRLLNYAYRPEALRSQLDLQTKYFIHNSSKNSISNNELRLSKIFKWFAIDFKNAEGGVIPFIQSYINNDISEVPISFLDYNWNLNN